jgi:signal transduction histidine kinase/ligand-binding sensor domain-containing protein
LLNKILIISLFSALIVSITKTASSQTLIPRFESLGVNDGLPHSSVYSITQDKKGFMWFGTPNGLCRYDGGELRSFKYNAISKDDVINNFVRGKLLEDKKGNIWYSNESGIYKWDVYKEKVEKVRPFKKEEFGNIAFRAVSIDTTGSLWFFNTMYGMFEFNTTNGNFKSYPLPIPTNLLAFKLATSVVDEEGNIWIRIVSQNEPWFVFNTASHTYSIQLADNPPHVVFFSNKKMILAFDSSLVYKNLQTNKSIVVPKIINKKKVSFHSFDGVKDNYGRLWMTAEGNGLFYYDEEHHSFQEYHHDNSKLKSLPFDLTTCLYIDRSQNLWIGLDGGGIAKLDLKQPRFNLFPLSEGDHPVLNDYFTKCFYEDEKGRTWFGTHTNGLNILDHQTGTLVNYQHNKNDPQSIPGNIVSAIIKDSDGNMWIGGSGGFSIFNEKKGTFKTIKLNGLPKLYPERNIFVYKMIQLKGGDLLAATLVGLVNINKQKNGSYEASHFNKNPNAHGATTDVVELPNGIIYSTATNDGLFEMTAQSTGYEITNIFLRGMDLRSVRIDEDNAEWLWVSTGIGLFHFNTRTKEQQLWNEKSGINNGYVYGLLEDGKNGFWISTNGGLSYFNKKTTQFDNYTYQDGLQSNEFNTQAFYKSASGNFYFGGIKGFNWFRAGQENNKQMKPAVAITKIEIGDHVFERDSDFVKDPNITVDYNNNDFSFEFAALDYTRPEANNIHYKLEGWDDHWITSSVKFVRYANLLPGNYTFRIKASNAEGTWSEEEKIVLFIKAAYWNQLWFRTITIILLLFIAVFITYRISQGKIKRKLQLLEKQLAIDAERNRISADMHDEIGSSLMHIALLGEEIQKRDKDVKEIKKDVYTLTTSAHKLVQTISEIIWALNPQNETLENLMAYLREQTLIYFEPFDIDYAIQFPDVVPVIQLSNEQRRNIFLVVKEALNNALKHSNAGKISLTMEYKNERSHFYIEDNGNGFDRSKIKAASNGLRNMQRRIEAIGGGFILQTTEAGTIIHFWFPA